MEETMVILTALDYGDGESGYVLYQVPAGKSDEAVSAILSGMRRYSETKIQDLRTVEDFIEESLKNAGIPSVCLNYELIKAVL